MHLLVLTHIFVFILRLYKCRLNPVEHLRSTYFGDGLKLYFDSKNASRKLEKAKLDLHFLEMCKIYNLVPKFLRFKLYRRSLHSSHIYRDMQSKLLENELISKRQTIAVMETRVLWLFEAMDRLYSKLDYFCARHHIKTSNNLYLASVKDIHSKKLEKLGGCADVKPCDPDKIVLNFSSTVLPPRLKVVLAFGLDFCLPVTRLDFTRYFLCFERMFYQLKTEMSFLQDQEKYRSFLAQFKSLATSTYYNFKKSKIFSVIKPSDFTLLKDLGKNRSLIVTKPDKGRAVVLVDRARYEESMLQILSDRSKFKLISDPIYNFSVRVEDRVNNFLRKLKDKFHSINDSLYQDLRSVGSGPGTLYGLPKVHKIDFSSKFQFRPIFAAYNLATYKLSKFLVPILSKIAFSSYTVENSTQFKNQVSDLNFGDSCFVASFDVENLFTCVPVSETIDISLDLLFAEETSLLGLNKVNFRKLLQITANNSFFQFGDKFYSQIEGLKVWD